MIEKFRDGKAEHSVSSLAELLGFPEQATRAAIKPLLELGLLEEVGNSFKIPMLYRDGLRITQGKAFEAGDATDDE
jgi:DNA-binding IclR family transcriptional regulator